MCVCGITETDNEYCDKVDNPSRHRAKCRKLEAWSGKMESDMGHLVPTKEHGSEPNGGM